MKTFAFDTKVNMASLDFSKYTGGSVGFVSSSEVTFTDTAGDVLDVKGQNFGISFTGPTGTITDFTLTDSTGHTVVVGSSLGLDLGKLYADRGSKTALAADLFSGGVSITGSAFADTLLGGAGKDILNGAAGKDTITGGGGDTVIGGAGQDTLSSGTGNVTFAYQAITDSKNATPDLIKGFHAGDKIDLGAIDAEKGVPGHQSFHLGATAGHIGDVVVSAYDSANDRTVVKLYVNADATADATIWLKGDHHSLTTADFRGVTAPAVSHMVSAMAGMSTSSAPASAFGGASPRSLTPVLASHH